MDIPVKPKRCTWVPALDCPFASITYSFMASARASASADR
jgi:hypothetical protein